MNTTIVEMRVHMDCPGCERKIVKSLSKLDGVDSVDIDVAMQKVTVTGWANQRKVLKTVRKSTGRRAELWPFPYNAECHEYFAHYYSTNGTPRSSSYSDQHTYTSPAMATYSVAPPAPLSSYNYRVHGYNGNQHGYYQQPPYSAILDEDATSMFSDDNATGCSVM